MYGSENQTEAAMPEREERDHEAKTLASIGGRRLVGDTAERPMSSTESAMMELEQEIMQLDESFSLLQRRLQPVMNEESQKMAEAETEARNARMPVSDLGRSINEKASRVRSIRRRIESATRSVDL